MGYVKDLWTRPEQQPDGKIKRVRIEERWGKGKRWLACWQDPDKKDVTQAFRNKTAAESFWKRMEADVERGEYIDPKAGLELVDHLWERWQSSRRVDPSTKIRDEGIFRLHIKPEIGGNTVKAVKPSAVKLLQTKVSERFGPSTVSGVRRVVVGMFDLAVADELIRKNPALHKIVDRVQPDWGPKIVAWADERVYAITDAHPPSLQLLPKVASTCGHRTGEVFALAEEDLDEDEGVIHIRRQIKKLGPHYVFALPKNDHTRIVPAGQWTFAEIREHMRRWPPFEVTLPWEKPDGEPQTHRLLVQWINGGHMKHRNYSEVIWKPALVAAEVIPPPVKIARGRLRYTTTRHEGMHQLRHYFASVMLASGVSIPELAEVIGHHDPYVTLRVYGHMLPNSHDRIRDAMDALMMKPRAVSAV